MPLFYVKILNQFKLVVYNDRVGGLVVQLVSGSELLFFGKRRENIIMVRVGALVAKGVLQTDLVVRFIFTTI